MLLQIVVENLALIEEILLSLGSGLNVLTGETGAGKSIVVDAMNILVGGRASVELVRNGADKASVEGIFDYSRSPLVPERLATLGLPDSEDQTVLLAREISRGGRSICRINGRVVPLALYRELGELLVDLHGQHDHQSLLKIDQHRELLDTFGGPELLARRDQVGVLYARLAALQEERRSLQMDEHEMARRIDYLEHAVQEIERINPHPGEDDQLHQERERLRNGEKLAELAKEAIGRLSEGDPHQTSADDLISGAAGNLQEMGRFDPAAVEMAATMDDISYKLQDLIESLKDYTERLDFDPEHAEAVEERLYGLRNLMQKYGADLAAVCTYHNHAVAELEALHNHSSRVNELEASCAGVKDEYDRSAAGLTELRHRQADILTQAVTEELHGLGMKNAHFDIAWDLAYQPEPFGYDLVEFIFSANPGEPLKPLARIASGGEMSRVMLALKVILAEADQIDTLIFDEIDSGIGGRTLKVVGDRLARVAAGRQVLCVTHSPNIAGRGQHHFYIEKLVSDGHTRTVVKSLSEAERVDELVRMLGGSPDDPVTRRHAEQILQEN
jgi:DNA repair protein RecN (Recombination protein N)